MTWLSSPPLSPPWREPRSLAQEWLDYVYLGNVSIPGAADTRCAKCGTLLIQRGPAYHLRIRADEKRRPACERKYLGFLSVTPYGRQTAQVWLQ